MLDFLGGVSGALDLWGAFVGLLLSAILTWGLSQLYWDSFNTSLFAAIAIPAVIAGVFIQYRVEKGTWK